MSIWALTQNNSLMTETIHDKAVESPKIPRDIASVEILRIDTLTACLVFLGRFTEHGKE